MLVLSPAEVTFSGPALPESFVQHELEQALGKALPSTKGAEAPWKDLLKSLRPPLANAGSVRVRNAVVSPLISGLGYTQLETAGDVRTREGVERGGWLLSGDNGHLRAWAESFEADLDAPQGRGLNHRFSPTRVAERVLLATGDRLGLVTNGVELRLIFSDPARRASFVSFSLSQWRQYRSHDAAPDAFRLLLAFTSPAGQAILPEVLEQAQIKQGQVTKDLRSQARQAIEGFIQGVLDDHANEAQLAGIDRETLARTMWQEALIMVYRLLFILRGESGGRETPPFSFVSTSLWRNTYSPTRAQPGNLAWLAQHVREEGMFSGEYLEAGLRALFRAFERGLDTSELHIPSLGGALFGPESTPLLDTLKWGEHGCALLLDNLLRAPRGKGRQKSLVRLSYRDLDVEELGRVYEALLELEPGIATEPMVRLQRAKLEVVVPAAQGEKYRSANGNASAAGANADDDIEDDNGAEGDEEGEETRSTGKTKIEWKGEIRPGQFFLRVGLGRKSSGAFYTPESFVKFLVQETLAPQCDAVSPPDDPQPEAILRLNVLDPAMGSGHFLVGACRYLGERLYEACRACAENGLWERVPEAIAPYLPGRQPEGESEAGFSAQRARALGKRLVAVHCLYGVDKNPLAVELAKVSLWLESFAEGLPLTFLDHRLVCGDSLLGPIDIVSEGVTPMTPPYATTPLDRAMAESVRARLRERLDVALQKVHALDATLGVSEEDILAKQAAKTELETALRPFVDLCVAWSGGTMLGNDAVDEEGYLDALRLLGDDRWPVDEQGRTVIDGTSPLAPGFIEMLRKGREVAVLAYPLAFPEVFFLKGTVDRVAGFDAVIGNPPWDRVRPVAKEFYASIDFAIVAAPTKRERQALETKLQSNPEIAAAFKAYEDEFDMYGRVHDTLLRWQSVRLGDVWAGRGNTDAYALFAERAMGLIREGGLAGLVLPSSFYANEGSTGLRQLYLFHSQLRKCYSFENKRKIFDIHSSFKFAIVIAAKATAGTATFDVAFYLHDDDWLYSEQRQPDPLQYSRQFVEKTGGDYLTFLELRSTEDLETASVCYGNGKPMADISRAIGIETGVQVDMTRDAWRFAPLSKIMPSGDDPRHVSGTSELSRNGFLLLHEGKTFHQYSDCWGEVPSYAVNLANLVDRSSWLDEARYFRLAYRRVASATNERTVIYCLLPPEVIAGNSAPIERQPRLRPNSTALWLMAVANSFCFDWTIRVRVSMNINQFILNSGPLPSIKPNESFLAHGATRLVCNHTGYASLWREQLGAEWREAKPRYTWPVLAGDDERWEVRSAIDAVVAQAYGLSRDQYAHVLSTFSHKSYPKAPALCLVKFDELGKLGLEAFTRQYDPYWDVPLVETLPQPVIDLPVLDQAAADGPKDLFGNPAPTNLFQEAIQPAPRGRRSKR